MYASLSVLQVLGLVLAGIVGGAALLTLLLGWISSASGGDSGESTGCTIIGGGLLLAAGYVAIRVLLSS